MTNVFAITFQLFICWTCNNFLNPASYFVSFHKIIFKKTTIKTNQIEKAKTTKAGWKISQIIFEKEKALFAFCITFQPKSWSKKIKGENQI